MITLKSREEVEVMRRANRIAAEAMARIGETIGDGATTGDLERVATELLLSRGAKPAFPTVQGYHHTLCVSVNEEIVHGIPGKRRLNRGDIVSVDCGVLFDGFFGDHAWSFPMGKVDEESQRLLLAGKESLLCGIEKARVGFRLGDIGAAVEERAAQSGFSVVRDYVGHGIGRALHEDPQVPNFGEAGTGMKLRRGLVLALEPMLNAGTHEAEVLSDGWTVVTKDRKRSVHFEHSVAIMDEGPEILSVL